MKFPAQAVAPKSPTRSAGRSISALQFEQMPRYSNLYLVLRQRILEGVYPLHSMLSSERDLTAEFGVARVTVRSALEALQSEGLVLRQNRRGTVVMGAPKVARATASVDAFEALFESFMNMALHTKVRVLAFGRLPASAEVALALGIPEHEPVLRVVRVRLQAQQPLSFSTIFVPQQFAEGVRRRDLAATPLLVLLRERGVQIDCTEERVSATQADLDVAAALSVPVGAALLRVTRTIRDDAGVAVEYFQGLFRPEYYEYQFVSARDPSRNRVTVVTQLD